MNGREHPGSSQPGEDQPAAGGHVEAPAEIVCVDCGGTCHLLSLPSQDADGTVGFRAGDVVSYRCSDCQDRWDIELE